MHWCIVRVVLLTLYNGVISKHKENMPLVSTSVMNKLNLVLKFIIRYIANCHPTVFVFFICQKTPNFKKIQNATNCRIEIKLEKN